MIFRYDWIGLDWIRFWLILSFDSFKFHSFPFRNFLSAKSQQAKKKQPPRIDNLSLSSSPPFSHQNMSIFWFSLVLPNYISIIIHFILHILPTSSWASCIVFDFGFVIRSTCWKWALTFAIWNSAPDGWMRFSYNILKYSRGAQHIRPANVFNLINNACLPLTTRHRVLLYL